MKVAVIYHFPLDRMATYRGFADRFLESYRRLSAGVEHYFLIGLSSPVVGTPQPAWLNGTGSFVCLTLGMDIATFIHASRLIDAEFIVCIGARVYFHRPDWLKRLLQVREILGDGLYCSSGSLEGSGSLPPPNPHARTSFFACSPQMLRDFPHPINSRDDCYRFESGEWNFSKRHRTWQVGWNDVSAIADCRKSANCFRRGTQENLLVFDGHTDYYHVASPNEKRRLERLADGIK